jgi:hypothetical protein
MLAGTGSSAETVALHRFRAAGRAGEPDLLMAIFDLDGPDAHRRAAAATLWKQRTQVGRYRLRLHMPSLQLIDGDRKGVLNAWRK